MLEKAEDLANFIEFVGIGGLQPAPNLTKGQQLKALADSEGARLSALVNEAVTDYLEASELVEHIQSLAGELASASGSLAGWNEYLITATAPEDLEQVSIGVEVIRKVNDIPDEEPAPSILPITSKPELADLESVINNLKSGIDEVVPLMSEVNSVLAPVEGGEGEDGGTGGTGGTTTTPALSSETKDAIVDVNSRFSLLVGTVAPSQAVIAQMVSEAVNERAVALDMFEKVVAFTISNNQKHKPSIRLAVLERFTL